MKDFLRRRVLHNFGIKLLSLALAVGLWLAVTRDPVAEVAVEVPIEFRNIPENLEISTESVPRAEIRVRGPQRIVRRLQPADIYYEIELSGMKPGERTFDLPAQRVIRMNYPLGWFRIQHIAVVDERTQTDTYLACSIMAEAAGTMLDNFVPDYLLERVEVELSHRIINGYYPRLGLAPGQRFASKGTYIVRFPDPAGTRVVAEGDWIVP